MGLAFGIIIFIACGIYVISMFVSKPIIDEAYEDYDKKKGYNLSKQWMWEDVYRELYPYKSFKEREQMVMDEMERSGYTYEWIGGASEICPNDAKHNPMKDPEYRRLNAISKFLGH